MFLEQRVITPDISELPHRLLAVVREMALHVWSLDYPDGRVLIVHGVEDRAQGGIEPVDFWKTNPPEPGRGWRVYCAPDSYDKSMLGEQLISYLALREQTLHVEETYDWGGTCNSRFWQDVYDWSPCWRRPFIAARAARYGIVLPRRKERR